ncbi:LysE family translocator [Desulfobaculum senezii]|jgi:threonine/homoserine/homoserine lactone efflux protein
MTLAGLLALAATFLVMAAVPGPAIVAVVSRGVTQGAKPALVFGLGLVLGDLAYLTAAMCGMGVVAREFGWVFTCIRYAGAAYLMWLGLRSLLRPSRVPARALTPAGGARTLAAGLALNLGNPKIIVFYCGILPAFVDLAVLTPLEGVVVAAVAMSVVYAVITAYALLGTAGGARFGSGAAMRRMQRGAGAVMLGAGVAVAVE